MALPATLVWEMRPANGTADGGGGFDPAVASPGTDFSQQNAVQVAYTDLVVGTPNTTITSAATPFTAADVGNNIAITTTGGGAAWTIGIYNIRSHAAAVVTLDRSPAATGSTAGVGNLGGARSGLSNGVTPIQGSGVMTAGNITYIKNEAWNEAVALAQAGAAGAPIKFIGYNSTRGDITLGDGNANNPVNNRAAAGGDGITSNVSSIEWHNINVTAAGDAGFSHAGSTFSPRYVNCKSYSNTGEGWEFGNSIGSAHFIGCESASNGGTGISGSAIALTTFLNAGCYIHDNGGVGVIGTTNFMILVNSIYDTNTGHNIQVTTGQPIMINSTSYGASGASADGFNATTPGSSGTVLNCIFASNGRYGVNATDADSCFEDYNCFNGNATAPRNPATNSPAIGTGGGWGPATHDVTTDPTFGNAASGNFSVGTNMKALGWPGAFPAALSTGFIDLGAVQREEAASGGGIFFGAQNSAAMGG